LSNITKIESRPSIPLCEGGRFNGSKKLNRLHRTKYQCVPIVFAGKIIRDNLNVLIKKAFTDNLSESEAYSLGAEIEANLNESGFIKLIKTSDAKTLALLHGIENDTKKHRVILVNYSRGIR
jgi:hypothetical protein